MAERPRGWQAASRPVNPLKRWQIRAVLPDTAPRHASCSIADIPAAVYAVANQPGLIRGRQEGASMDLLIGVERMRGESTAMPGLRLTPPQAARLLGLDR
jgi:hypothetical protein